MRKITFGFLTLLMFASCSNPIEAGEDDGQVTNNDTSLHTDPGDGVSSRTDSLLKEDEDNGFPKVNTVTGEMQGTQGNKSASNGAGETPGAQEKPAQEKPAQNKPGTK